MPVSTSYIEEERRLDLIFDGNFDVSVSQGVCDLCEQASSDLRSCIIDLSGVERMFDSGVALLQMLHRRLRERGIIVVILSDDPEIRERVRAVVRNFSSPSNVRPVGQQVLARAVEPERSRL